MSRFPPLRATAARRLRHGALATALAAALLAAPLGPAWAVRGEVSPAGPESAPPRPSPPADGAAETEAAPAKTAVAYETAITGVPEDGLRGLLRRTSQLVALQDKPPSTMAGLQRRARDDMERLLTALRSEGFYGARLDTAIDETVEPVAVRVEVEAGPVYLLASYAIDYAPPVDPQAQVPRGPEDLDLHLGMRARAPRIVAAQRTVLRRLEEQGYPLAEVAERTVRVDHDATTVAVELRVDPGPLARYGAVAIKGLEGVEEAYVRGFLALRPGERYDAREVEAVRTGLRNTGLFASVRLGHGERVGADGRLPLSLEVSERARRSVGFGAEFSTSEGPAGSAFWEHRNIFGRAERLRLSLELGFIEQILDADLRKPRYLRPDQDLRVETTATRHDSEAFDERSLAGFLGLERDIGKGWRGSLGMTGEITETRDNEGTRTFGLLGTPLRLSRDTSDDLLNPTEGTRAHLAATPYLATIADELGFVRSSLTLSHYLALDAEARYVLAARGRAGTILGTSTENVPASKRFFAGGGGSVRGFDFEKLGPLDGSNDPLGGRSLLELGLELRVRVGADFGFVPFIDAGNVYDDPYFDDGGAEPILWAAGLGFRYFTAVGPLRVDVATPLNPRAVDDDYEFYISLGQAF